MCLPSWQCDVVDNELDFFSWLISERSIAERERKEAKKKIGFWESQSKSQIIYLQGFHLDVNDYENFQVESRTLTPLKSSDEFIPISKNQQLVSDAFGPAAEMPDSVKDKVIILSCTKSSKISL